MLNGLSLSLMGNLLSQQIKENIKRLSMKGQWELLKNPPIEGVELPLYIDPHLMKLTSNLSLQSSAISTICMARASYTAMCV